MKKILLIARAKTPETRASASNFASNVQSNVAEDIQIEECEISELAFELNGAILSIYHPAKNFDLKDFDLVVVRHIGAYWVEAHAIAVYCELNQIDYTDKYLNRLLLDNKLSTQFLLWANGLKSWPKTLYGPSQELAARFSGFGERAVLKDNEGSKGRHNFVVTSAEEIQSITSKHPDKRFLLQEFIPNDSDLRVLIFNNQPVLVIRRQGDGSSHLNNTSQGGEAEILPIDSLEKHVLDMALRAAEITKLTVAGVDIVRNLATGDQLLLEVNNAPQVSSGSFVPEKTAAYAQMLEQLLADSVDTAKENG